MDRTLFRQLLKNNVALALQYVAGAAVPLVLVPHLATKIGLTTFGALSVILSWAMYGSTLVTYSFQLTGPVQAAREQRQGAAFSAMLGARAVLLLVALAVLFAAAAAGAIPQPSGTGLVVILVGLPLAAALNSGWYLQVRDRYLWISLLSVAGTVASLYAGLAFVQGPDPDSTAWAALALVLGSLFVSAGTLLLSLRLLKGIAPFRWTDIAAALAQGRALFLSQLAALGYSASGPILIAWMAGLEQAGTYSVMERLATSLSGAMLLIHTAAYPLLVRLFDTDRQAFLRTTKWVTAGYLALASALGLAAWFFRDAALGYLYGAAGPRPYTMYALGLCWVWLAIFGPMLTAYLVVSNKARQVYTLTLSVLAVSLAIGIPGVMLQGGEGWFIGLVAGQLLVAASALIYWKTEHEHQHR